MHSLAAASRAGLLETKPTLFCSKLPVMRSGGDIAINPSLRTNEHEYNQPLLIHRIRDLLLVASCSI